jgi:hypothetical protein
MNTTPGTVNFVIRRAGMGIVNLLGLVGDVGMVGSAGSIFGAVGQAAVAVSVTSFQAVNRTVISRR